MWQIRKYVIPAPDSKGRVNLLLKFNYRVITVGLQDDQIVVWVMEDLTRQTSEMLMLHIHNTGDTLERIRNLKHIATVTSLNGIVWHVFQYVHDDKHGHEVYDATD